MGYLVKAKSMVLRVKKRSFLYGTLLLCLLFFNACTSVIIEDELIQSSNAVKLVTMSADNILSGNSVTRTDFTLESDKLKFAWADGDKVGVWPKDGMSSQVEFSITSGVGQSSARFDGGAWALRDDMQYAAYYPYNVSNSESNNSNIRFSYEGQAQTGNASLAHLGTHDLMATNATSAVEGALNFQFKHVNSVAQMRLTVPVATTFTSLTVRSDENIFAKVANLDLSGDNYIWSVFESTNQLQMSLSNVYSTESLNTVVCYMMLPPVDMSGKTVYVILQSSDNKVYQGMLTPKNLQSGRAYSFSAILEDVTISSSITAPDFGSANI